MEFLTQGSIVTCHLSHVMCFILFLFVKQMGGASWWRVCYQQGIPNLVIYVATIYVQLIQFLCIIIVMLSTLTHGCLKMQSGVPICWSLGNI